MTKNTTNTSNNLTMSARNISAKTNKTLIIPINMRDVIILATGLGNKESMKLQM